MATENTLLRIATIDVSAAIIARSWMNNLTPTSRDVAWAQGIYQSLVLGEAPDYTEPKADEKETDWQVLARRYPTYAATILNLGAALDEVEALKDEYPPIMRLMVRQHFLGIADQGAAEFLSNLLWHRVTSGFQEIDISTPLLIHTKGIIEGLQVKGATTREHIKTIGLEYIVGAILNGSLEVKPHVA